MKDKLITNESEILKNHIKTIHDGQIHKCDVILNFGKLLPVTHYTNVTIIV